MIVHKISTKLLTLLSQEANLSFRGRQHQNLHDSYSAPCQRLLNEITSESYIRPHRHLLDPKCESLFAVRGCFCLMIFSSEGLVVDNIYFGSEKYLNEKITNVGVEIDSGIWHTVIGLSENATLLEVKAGPFMPANAKDYPNLAPCENTLGAKDYFDNLKELVRL